MNIAERLRNAVHHWPANVAALMADAAQRIETLEANAAGDYGATPAAREHMEAFANKRYYIEYGVVRMGPDGRGLIKRVRDHWKIYDRTRTAWSGNGPLCVAYYYVEDAAYAALAHLNSPVQYLPGDVVSSHHERVLKDLAESRAFAKKQTESFLSADARAMDWEKRCLGTMQERDNYQAQLTAAIRAAVSRTSGVTLPEHVKHLEELAIDRARLLDDQTAKLYAGQTAEQWFTKCIEVGEQNAQYYKGYSAQHWYNQWEKATAEIMRRVLKSTYNDAIAERDAAQSALDKVVVKLQAIKQWAQ